MHAEDKDIISFVNETCNSDSKVLEIGGGSGALLDLIESNSSVTKLYNCDFVPETYQFQANPNINLIGCTALNLPFQDQTFDYCIAKNLLHHLVGSTQNESKLNAAKAVEELIRVVKNEGFVIILEQYNKCNLCTTLLFHATLLFSHMGISSKFFGMGKNVIVSFLTPGEIQNLLCGQNSRITKISLLKNINNDATIALRFKLSLLMSKVGVALLIARIDKSERQSDALSF
ncbi:MAG: class I SAM-dependent methyltransferase [Halobacteriota archaeon]